MNMGLIASSAHLYAIAVSLSNTANTETRPAVVAGIGINKMDFLKPVRPGDVLSMKSSTLDCRLSDSRENTGIIADRSELYNQNNEAVFAVEGSFLVHCRVG